MAAEKFKILEISGFGTPSRAVGFLVELLYYRGTLFGPS